VPRRMTTERGHLDGTRTSGHTFGMKVAISVPDDIFDEAESLARRLNTSRSELYSRALTEFVGHHAPDRITECMNQVVADIGVDKPDEFRAEAARRVFKHTEW
jgi:metal-responsive CopG/Arc/MetJ family transcriptional regulator